MIGNQLLLLQTCAVRFRRLTRWLSWRSSSLLWRCHILIVREFSLVLIAVLIVFCHILLVLILHRALISSSHIIDGFTKGRLRFLLCLDD